MVFDNWSGECVAGHAFRARKMFLAPWESPRGGSSWVAAVVEQPVNLLQVCYHYMPPPYSIQEKDRGEKALLSFITLSGGFWNKAEMVNARTE